VTERERHELSLVENLQREDLNAIEEAESVRRLMDEAGLTQEEVARRLGKSRSAVANKIRLLDLPQMLRNALIEELLSEGHARALVGRHRPGWQEELGKRVVHEKLTVRDVEALACQAPVEKGFLARPVVPKEKIRMCATSKKNCSGILGRRVVINSRGNTKGWVRLDFYSIDDLDVHCQQLRSVKGAKSERMNRWGRHLSFCLGPSDAKRKSAARSARGQRRGSLRQGLAFRRPGKPKAAVDEANQAIAALKQALIKWRKRPNSASFACDRKPQLVGRHGSALEPVCRAW
jgi:hypothetical protein